MRILKDILGFSFIMGLSPYLLAHLQVFYLRPRLFKKLAASSFSARVMFLRGEFLSVEEAPTAHVEASVDLVAVVLWHMRPLGRIPFLPKFSVACLDIHCLFIGSWGL